jgi:hypothetical protein
VTNHEGRATVIIDSNTHEHGWQLSGNWGNHSWSSQIVSQD